MPQCSHSQLGSAYTLTFKPPSSSTRRLYVPILSHFTSSYRSLVTMMHSNSSIDVDVDVRRRRPILPPSIVVLRPFSQPALPVPLQPIRRVLVGRVRGGPEIIRPPPRDPRRSLGRRRARSPSRLRPRLPRRNAVQTGRVEGEHPPPIAGLVHESRPLPAVVLRS